MNDIARSRTVWAWASLGLAGSLLTAIAAPAAIPDNSWWVDPSVPGGRGVAMPLVFAGAALLAAGWIGVGRFAAGERTGWLVAIGAVWLAPLVLAPPLFSRDVYSYIAQGTILHLGHNPYNTAPAALAGLGQDHVLSAVSPFWRHTTSPYGPLFLGLMSVVVSITGSHLIAGVLRNARARAGRRRPARDLRAALARALGADRGASHVARRAQPAARARADRRRPQRRADDRPAGRRGHARAPGPSRTRRRGLCARGDGQAAGAGRRAVHRGRLGPLRARPLRADQASGASALAAVGVLAAVSIVTGLGFSWLTTSVFSTPAKVHLAITPSTAIGWTVAELLRDAGVAVGHRTVATAFGVVTLAITASPGRCCCGGCASAKVALYLGLLLLIAAACGPAAWPWYFTWGLVLLAGCPGWQRSARWRPARSSPCS